MTEEMAGAEEMDVLDNDELIEETEIGLGGDDDGGDDDLE
jgi:hypothetical protein